MSRPIIIDRKGRQWLEETVVVQREKENYGITLAEAQPVFVQKTSKDGPADRAGIQPGDRIIKVNGTSIMNKSHLEVVGMIKKSSFVSLTLMRKISGDESRHRSKSRSANGTGNGFVPLAEQSKMSGDNLAFSPQNLKTLLKKQRSQYEKLTVQFARTQDDKLMAEIMECQVLIRDLEEQIAAQSPTISSHIRATQASIAALRGHKRSRSDSSKLAQLVQKEVEEAASRTPQPTRSATTKAATGKTVVFSDVLEKYSPPPAKQSKFKLPFHSSTKSSASASALQQSWSPPTPAKKKEKDATMDVSPVSSDNEEDMNIVDRSSPFQSLQSLKGSPAHIAVFLHYMLDMHNKDPKKLCFYLVTQSYQDMPCKPFELKPKALDIFLTFLHEQSPLFIDLEGKHAGVAQRILDTLQYEELESKLRPIFMEARSLIQPSIEKSLSEFQQKRLMGLGWMFGDQKLSDTMAPDEVAEAVYSTLLPHIRDIMKDVDTADGPTRLRQTALGSCVATLVLDVGKPKSKMADMAYLDKLTSITKCDVKKMKQKRKTENRQGHQFVPTIFAKPVMCDLCSKLLWSIGVHGLQCSNCDMILHHTEECLSEVHPCHKDKKKAKNYISATLPLKKTASMVEWDGSYDDQFVDNEEALMMGSSSQPDVRTTLKERSQSLVDAKAVLVMNEVKERGSVSVSRALSEKLPEKPHFSAIRSRLPDGLVSSPSTLSFPASLPHIPTLSMEDVKRGSVPPNSPLPDGSRGVSFDMDVEADLRDKDLVVDELVPWAYTVDAEVVERYNKYEKERQELIREFVHTERTHLKKLKVMLYIYKKPLIRQMIISHERVLQLFPNLEELILIHGMLLTDLKARMVESADEVRGISDILLQRFDGEAGERLKKACAVFASNQSRADVLFKTWKRSDERFKMFVKTAESHPICGRLKLTELTPIVWTRLTKYKLLVEGLIKQFVAQRTKVADLSDDDELELSRLQMVHARVKNILEEVNREVKQAARHSLLMDYQNKLDTSALEKSSSKLAYMFKGLDLTEGGRVLLHEGPLTWKLQTKKIELHALLLSDIFVLMERDVNHDRYVLRTHTQTDIKGNKDELSPVIRLGETLWRDAATDRGGRTFFLASNSPLTKYAQMYELLAETADTKAKWEAEFKKATQACKEDVLSDSTRGDDDSASLISSDTTLSPLMSPTPSMGPMTYPEHLMKIDKTIVKLLEEKLSVIQGAQLKEKEDKATKESSTENPSSDASLESPVHLARAAIEQACVMVSAANAFLVPELQIPTFVTAQSAIAEHAVNLQRYLTALMRMLSGTEDYERRASTHTLVEEIRLGSPMSDESPEPETEGRNEDREALVREESKNTAGLSTSLTSSQDSTSEGDVEESEEAAATLHDIMVFDFSNDDTGKEDPPGEDSLSSVASKTGEAATPDEAAQDDLELPQPPSQPPPPLAPTVQGSSPDTQPHNGDCPTHESLIAKLLSADQSTSSLTGSSITSFDEDISFVAPPPPPSFADHPTEADSTTEPSFEGGSGYLGVQEEEDASDEVPPPLPLNPPPSVDLVETVETGETTDNCTQPSISLSLCNPELNETSEA